MTSRKIPGTAPVLRLYPSDAASVVRVGTWKSPTSANGTLMGRSRRGFTLIELLVVVVIIGVLAAIAVPKFTSTKGKANAASLKSDLRNLATAQEAYFYENLVYTNNTSALNISLTNGVTITWGTVSAAGWSAKVTHPLAYPIECAIFIGTVAPMAPAITEGQLVCQ
jgi:type IV pilus assembly protein PilA